MPKVSKKQENAATPSGLPPLKVALISLGCAKNLVDSEIILGSLLKKGMALTADTGDADILLINTCSFIQSAQEESINAILEQSGVLRERTSFQTVVVTGCLPQRFPEDLPGLMPEVDGFLGVDQVEIADELIRKAMEHRRQVVALYAEFSGKSKNKKRVKDPELPSAQIKISKHPTYIHTAKTPRLGLTPKYFNYVKIAEGCNHGCAFCAIPQIRGHYRSRMPEDILEEARAAIKNGCKEINLISQDTTRYGFDLLQKGKILLPEISDKKQKNITHYLLKKVAALRGDFWVRLLYTHPAHWTDELLSVMAKTKKAVKYVDIPLQHIHPLMLERMRRETSEKYIRDLLQKIRVAIPEVTIRTTFIVGFPGETEECFQSLLDFIVEQKFQKVGVFMYSAQEGTRAAAMKETVPESLKRKRLAKLMSIQREISLQYNQSLIGKKMRVLVERPVTKKDLEGIGILAGESGQTRGSVGRKLRLDHSYWVARAEGDAPDVDGRVFIKGDSGLQEGIFTDVTITDSGDYDLISAL